MAKLGNPEKVTYISKELVSGYEDIVAHVMKPNGDIVGPFPLTEETNINFRGFYSFSFPTNETNDENGIYVGVFTSPEEGGHRAPFKLVYEEISIEGVSEAFDSVSDVIRQINSADVEIEIEEMEEIEVIMEGA